MARGCCTPRVHQKMMAVCTERAGSHVVSRVKNNNSIEKSKNRKNEKNDCIYCVSAKTRGTKKIKHGMPCSPSWENAYINSKICGKTLERLGRQDSSPSCPRVPLSLGPCQPRPYPESTCLGQSASCSVGCVVISSVVNHDAI